jgi:hypothetical protein
MMVTRFPFEDCSFAISACIKMIPNGPKRSYNFSFSLYYDTKLKTLKLPTHTNLPRRCKVITCRAYNVSPLLATPLYEPFINCLSDQCSPEISSAVAAGKHVWNSYFRPEEVMRLLKRGGQPEPLIELASASKDRHRGILPPTKHASKTRI